MATQWTGETPTFSTLIVVEELRTQLDVHSRDEAPPQHRATRRALECILSEARPGRRAPSLCSVVAPMHLGREVFEEHGPDDYPAALLHAEPIETVLYDDPAVTHILPGDHARHHPTAHFG